MSTPRSRRIPSLLAAGLIATAVSDGVMPIANHVAAAGNADLAWLRITLLAWALDLVALFALARGAAALRDVSAGRVRHSAHLAALAFAVAAVVELAASASGLVAGELSGQVVSLGAQVARLVGYGALIAASVDRRDPRSTLLSLAAAVTAALSWPLSPLYQAATLAAVNDPSASRTLYLVLVGVGLELLLLALIASSAGRAPLSENRTDPATARLGLHAVSSALSARAVLVAMAVPVVALVPGTGFLLFSLLVASGAASVAVAIGAGRASRWCDAGAPSGRFALAAVLVGASAAFQLGLASSMLVEPATTGDDGRVLATFAETMLLIPALDLAGLLTLVSALAATAHQAGTTLLARRLPAIALGLAVCTAATTWLFDLAAHASPPSPLLPLLVALATATAMVVLAHAARLLSVRLGQPVAVPIATARQRSGAS